MSNNDNLLTMGTSDAYVTRPDVPIVARELQRGEYFDKVFVKKGDFIITLSNSEMYHVPKELFQVLFCRHYSCLQEFIDDNREQNEKVLSVLADNWEKL